MILRDPSSPVQAEFLPSAGMIGVSLTDADVQLLGLRRGLEAYLTTAKTMGIPLLYPWANRLSATGYTAEGRDVTLTPGRSGVHVDANGLPIHGLVAGYPDWRVTTESASELVAELDFGADPALLAGFPFPHLLTLQVTLTDRTLRLRSTVTATTETTVPLCYGFHPYLQLPEVPRAAWLIDTPVMRHLALDSRGIPTGASTPAPATSMMLGDTICDDGYDQIADGAVFAVSGGDRRIEVCFESGYPAAQIFAPAGEAVVCFEPMTAPTDALRRGGYRVARLGRPGVAQFSIRIS